MDGDRRILINVRMVFLQPDEGVIYGFADVQLLCAGFTRYRNVVWQYLGAMIYTEVIGELPEVRWLRLKSINGRLSAGIRVAKYGKESSVGSNVYNHGIFVEWKTGVVNPLQINVDDHRGIVAVDFIGDLQIVLSSNGLGKFGFPAASVLIDESGQVRHCIYV